MMNILNLALFCIGVAAITAYDGRGLPPGPYCGGPQVKCCKDRQDHCSAKIHSPGGDSVCYCDDFCDDLVRRNSKKDDCCPDFLEVCRGQTPPPDFIIACADGNKYYIDGQKIKRGCNECTCKQDLITRTAYFVCDTDPCIMSDEVLRGVASDPYSTWRPYNYSQFHGKKLKDGLIYKLGTLPLNSVKESPLSSKTGVNYPMHFDAKQRWPDHISPVVDQEWCGSDWAITVATVASDRFAIQSNGAEKVVLSPQMLLSCNRGHNRGQPGCKGGHVDKAWNYARLYGLVDEECFPYKASSSVQCKFSNREDQDQLIKDGCRPVVPGRTSRYKVGPLYRIKNEADIMYEIMISGPVHAVMTVYQDFFHYHDGIYKRSRYGNNYMNGLHSVRIIGWGEDRGDKYWIIANSWGCDWGENGYFRIARGQNESGIESFVVASWSEVTEAYKRRE